MDVPINRYDYLDKTRKERNDAVVEPQYYGYS